MLPSRLMTSLCHHLVCQFVFVLWQKAQGNMSYRLCDSGIQLSLEFKAVDDVMCLSQQHAIGGKDSGLFLACHIVDSSAK